MPALGNDRQSRHGNFGQLENDGAALGLRAEPAVARRCRTRAEQDRPNLCGPDGYAEAVSLEGKAGGPRGACYCGGRRAGYRGRGDRQGGVNWPPFRPDTQA